MSFNFITGWADEDSFTLVYKRELLGIKTLNNLSNEKFKEKLCEYIKYIKVSKKINGIELYWKHDISNGIFTLLQLNVNLDDKKYHLISKMREQMWNYIDNTITKDYISYDAISDIIVNV